MVAQSFATEAENTYVILGNSALVECKIPSHVSDFVTVESWADSDGNEYFHDETFGKRP